MAAMLDESAAAAAAATAGPTSANGGVGYMGPSGRGIGYLGGGNARDSGNYAQIPTPSNKAELELYRLLDRANLLNYFGTFLNFGGDDVQQLSDADEDEFLEIMSLVGMTQKPLHVRRLQKALIEWRELDNSFKRQLNFATTTSNNYPQPQTQPTPRSHPNCTGSSPANNNNNNHCQTQQHRIPVELGTPIQASTPSLRPANDNRQQYALPHELFGAPKRLRLMDNLHKKVRTDQLSSATQAIAREPGEKSSDSCLDFDEEENDRYDDENELSCQEHSARSDDDKIIEIVDSPLASSIDGLELDEVVQRPVCVSPKSSNLALHSKYGRYKASLLESPDKVRSK